MLSTLEAAGDIYQGIQLKSGGPLFETARQQLVDHLITSLGKRFADSIDGIIRATGLLNLSSWPEKENSAGTKSNTHNQLFVLHKYLYCINSLL